MALEPLTHAPSLPSDAAEAAAMPVVRVPTRGRTTIPAELRKELGIEPGTWVALRKEGREIHVSVIGDDLIRATRGMLKGDGPPLAQALRKERARDREREEAGAPPMAGPNRPVRGSRGPS